MIHTHSLGRARSYYPERTAFASGEERSTFRELHGQLVIDKEPLDLGNDSFPADVYDPDAVFALIYTSGTTGRPKGVALTHSNILANLDHVNYWMRFREGGVYLHAAPIFHIAEFPFMFASPAFGTCQV